MSSDCNATAAAPDLTDQQLMQVAKRMGREWKVVAISCLGLSKQDLEEMEAAEESVTMLKFNMLERWRRRQPKGRAGIQDLHKCLKDNDDVPNEVIAVLDGECGRDLVCFSVYAQAGGMAWALCYTWKRL